MNADSLGRQDLSGAFASSGTDRTAGLGRLKRRAQPTEDAPVDSGPPSSSADPAPEPTLEPAPEPVATTAPAPDESAADLPEKNTNYQVYVPAHVLAPFKQARLERGTSNAFLVFDAIEALVDPTSDDPYAKLRELVQKDLLPSASLFTRAPRRRSTAADLGPRVPVMLRVTPSNRQAIEELVRQTGAVDRGHLVTIALVNHLDIKGVAQP